MSHLLQFFGEECPHCVKMDGLIKDLKQKDGINVEQFEVWHNDDNMKKMEEYDKGYCGGVPFFINTESGKWICGEADYDELKDWAEGK